MVKFNELFVSFSFEYILLAKNPSHKEGYVKILQLEKKFGEEKSWHCQTNIKD